MAKLLQNGSNLNDLEYLRHLKARKIEKRPKYFLKANQRLEVEKLEFSYFLDFLRLIGSENSCDGIFFHFRSHKDQKGHYKAKS